MTGSEKRDDHIRKAWWQHQEGTLRKNSLENFSSKCLPLFYPKVNIALSDWLSIYYENPLKIRKNPGKVRLIRKERNLRPVFLSVYPTNTVFRCTLFTSTTTPLYVASSFDLHFNVSYSQPQRGWSIGNPGQATIGAQTGDRVWRLATAEVTRGGTRASYAH